MVKRKPSPPSGFAVNRKLEAILEEELQKRLKDDSKNNKVTSKEKVEAKKAEDDEDFFIPVLF
ncbi:MAG: hypothetical protein FWC76_00705 [Defluviitaleaceae bacterium]|nr:hypothetical protein [Defluviitaleaceae bacterium]